MCRNKETNARLGVEDERSIRTVLTNQSIDLKRNFQVQRDISSRANAKQLEELKRGIEESEQASRDART